MTKSLWIASFLILESWTQHFNTCCKWPCYSMLHVNKKGVVYNTLMEREERGFPLYTTTAKLHQDPQIPLPMIITSSPCSLNLIHHLFGSGSPSLSWPEPFSSLAFPFASSHPSLRVWSLDLLCQIHQQGLLTMLSKT